MRRLVAVGTTAAALAIVASTAVTSDERADPRNQSAPTISATSTLSSRLPEQGFAIDLEGELLLVTLKGKLLARLPGYKLTVETRNLNTPGPLVLRGLDGTWLLEGGAKRLRRYGESPPLKDLDVQDARWPTLGLAVSYKRDVITTGWGGGRPPFAFGRRTGGARDLPLGCVVADTWSANLLLMCRDPDLPRSSLPRTIEHLKPSGERRVVLTPPRSESVPAGGWLHAATSADGSSIVAQWSGECEVPIAFFAKLGEDEPIPVTGEGSWTEAPASIHIGWDGSGQALFHLPGGLCASGMGSPGVYFSRRPGQLGLLFPTHPDATVRQWRDLSSTG